MCVYACVSCGSNNPLLLHHRNVIPIRISVVFSKPEVNEIDLVYILPTNHDVLGLEVPMDQIFLMKAFDTVEKLQRQLEASDRREAFRLPYEVLKVLP